MFFFDLFSAASYILRVFTSSHYIRLLSLCRITRLSTFNIYMNRCLMRLEVNSIYLEILYLLSTWMLFIHWTACLFIVPGLISSNFQTKQLIGAWYEQPAFQSQDLFGRYVICLFKSVKTLTGTAYTDTFQATQQFDKIYVSCFTVIGRVGLFVTIAYMYQLIQGMRSSQLRYREMTVELSKYSQHNHLPEATRAKLQTNYEFVFLKRYFNERDILQTSSTSLRQQILIHNTRHLVENSPFFHHLPSYLIMRIISALSVELFSVNDIILNFGEIGKSIYFITSGSVALYTPGGWELCHLSDGDYFGETTLVSGNVEHQHVKVVALEMTECYK
jgi:Cyclic nucleotide-binding domain